MGKLMRTGASCLVAGGIAFAAACSSGTDAEGAEPAHERASARQSAAATRSTSTVPVCDLIRPFADDAARAFGLGFELAPEGPRRSGMSSQCHLDMKVASTGTLPEGAKATLLISRFAALHGNNVRAYADSHDGAASLRPVPSVGPDAVLITLGDGEALALFSHGGRVWGVQSNVLVPQVAGIDDATGAAAGVVRAGLEK